MWPYTMHVGILVLLVRDTHYPSAICFVYLHLLLYILCRDYWDIVLAQQDVPS